MATKRQLAAIMYTDIAGFSYMLNHNPKLATKIRQRHLEVFKDAHERHQGNIILQVGDSTLSIFNSAVQAVECAYMLQVELGKEPEIPLRIGIHTGEILYDEGGAYGDGISMAARIQRLAVARSIYISSKVYDDIKNHSWLTADSLGNFRIDELQSIIQLYVISNRGLVVPNQLVEENHEFNAPRKYEEVEEETQYLGKSKIIAGFLALFFGLVGVHRFYLGQRWRGILYFIASSFLMIATIEEDIPLIGFMWVIAMIDAILLFAMPAIEFDDKYNYVVLDRGRRSPKRKKRKRGRLRSKRTEKQSRKSTFSLLKSAIRQYENRHLKPAVKEFDQLLSMEKDNPVAHYYLACCFSLMKDADSAVMHLDKALSYGFDDLDRIKRDRALSYLRSQSQFSQIKAYYFDEAPSLPSATADILESDVLELSPLEKLEHLGNQLEEGKLSRSEFEVEKRKILGS